MSMEQYKFNSHYNEGKNREEGETDEEKIARGGRKVSVVPLFASPIMVTNINRNFTEDEMHFACTKIPMHNTISVKEYYKEYYSDKDMEGEVEIMTNHRSIDTQIFDNFPKELGEIHKFCKQQIECYLKEIEGVNTDLAGLRITQSWLNNTKPGESHHIHSHANSYLSGVLYLKCLPDDNIIFSNRSHGLYNNLEFPLKTITAWNASGHRQMILEGDLIIFPSHLLHHVNINESKDKERISLAFNTFPMGEMGASLATHLIL